MTDEALRALERAAHAQGGAAEWTAYAQALARAGRSGEAYTAASRAITLEPSSPARELLTPCWVERSFSAVAGRVVTSVPWRGLRELAAPRLVSAGGLMQAGLDARDLGRGLVAFAAEGEVTPPGWLAAPPQLNVADVVTGEVLWKDASPIAVRFAVGNRAIGIASEREPNTLVARDPASGRELARGAMPTAVRTLDFFASALALDERTLAGLSGRAPLGVARSSQLLLLDVETLEVVGEAVLPKTEELQLVAADGRILAIADEDRGEVAAFDRSGERLWRVPFKGKLASEDRFFAGHARGQLYFSLEDGRTVVRIDAADGKVHKPVASPSAGELQEVFAFGDLLVFRCNDDDPRVGAVIEDGLLGVAPDTLEVLWRAERANYAWLAATADSLLVVEIANAGARGGARRAGSVVAIDPKTGETTARIDFGRTGPFGPPLLAAGRIVFGANSKQKDASLVVIDDASLAPSTPATPKKTSKPRAKKK